MPRQLRSIFKRSFNDEKHFCVCQYRRRRGRAHDGAAALGERVTLITSGSTYGCASIVYTYPAELSAVDILPAAAALVAASGAELLICENSSDGKLVGGYCAAKLGASPLCDSQGLDFDGEGLISTRLVYGGSAIKTEKSPLPAVAIMNAGVFDASASSGAPEMLELEVSAQDGLELVGTSALETSTVNLACKAGRRSRPRPRVRRQHPRP